MGPFNLWPNGFGFGYFYGFLAGETSQWEPRLYENRNPIEPPHDPKYHISISGTQQREMLSTDADIPPEFSRPEVVAILKEYYASLRSTDLSPAS